MSRVDTDWEGIYGENMKNKAPHVLWWRIDELYESPENMQNQWKGRLYVCIFVKCDKCVCEEKGLYWDEKKKKSVTSSNLNFSRYCCRQRHSSLNRQFYHIRLKSLIFITDIQINHFPSPLLSFLLLSFHLFSQLITFKPIIWWFNSSFLVCSFSFCSASLLCSPFFLSSLCITLSHFPSASSTFHPIPPHPPSNPLKSLQPLQPLLHRHQLGRFRLVPRHPLAIIFLLHQVNRFSIKFTHSRIKQ